MKVTLIRCPQTFTKYVSAAYALPPIGLTYVAASLREAGHAVKIIDTNGEALDRFTPLDAKGLLLRRGLSDEEILERLEPSDVIGFGLMFRAVITERQESRLDKSLVEMKRRVIRTWKGKPGLRLGEINPH
jgi:hypothetical protein